jgi:hypothetical protein
MMVDFNEPNALRQLVYLSKRYLDFLAGIKKALHLDIRLTFIWLLERVRAADLMINSNF